MKRIYLTVTNDLNYDQRMIRICRSLAAAGYRVVLTGRLCPGSLPLREETFVQKRLRCLFQRGKLFYLEYNIRLFLFLLFRNMDGICAIDLDTIVPCLLVSRLKRVPRVFDAHEYFSEMKEVITRPAVKWVWKKVERITIPRFPHGYTVSDSIAREFRERYGVQYQVIRNVPVLMETPGLPLPDAVPAWVATDRFILYQGAVNEARGLESLIRAMRKVEARLLICGEGNRMEACRKLVHDYRLQEKVVFTGPVEPDLLKQLTHKAHIGINLVEPLGLNQYYSLANKFFDYIHAGVPQLTMDFPEYRRINDELPIALLIPDTEEEKITEGLNNLLRNDVLYGMLQGNCAQARLRYNWKEEEILLIRLYRHLFD